MKPVKIEDLPAKVRAQVEAKLAGRPVTAGAIPAGSAAAAPDVKHPRKQTATEREYNRVYLNGAGRFEALTLRLPGGSRYTPDFLTLDGGRVTLHEVKGGYRLGSHGRALTAFREAVEAFPFFSFVWAVRKDDGWKVAAHEGTTPDQTQAHSPNKALTSADEGGVS